LKTAKIKGLRRYGFTKNNMKIKVTNNFSQKKYLQEVATPCNNERRFLIEAPFFFIKITNYLT